MMVFPMKNNAALIIMINHSNCVDKHQFPVCPTFVETIEGVFLLEKKTSKACLSLYLLEYSWI